MNIPKALRGVLVLTGSSFALRAMSMVYRIYLSGKLGPEGLGLNQLISSVCGFAALCCSTGIATAVMRLCAEKPQQAKAVLRRAQLLALGLAALCMAALLVLAPLLARHIIRYEAATLPLRLYAVALPFIAASACLRGYFLAAGHVGRVTLAQFIEQILRIGLSVLLLERLGQRLDTATALAVVFLSSAIGEVVSLLCYELLFRAHKPPQSPLQQPAYGQLASIGTPILLATLVQSGMQTVESLLIPPMLGLSGAGNALAQYGIMTGMVLPILFFPAALPGAIGTLRMPAVARHNAQGNRQAVQENVRISLGSTMMVSMLFMALFLSLCQPLMQVLYKNADAAALLFTLAPLLPLLYLDRIADTLLKGIGRQKAALAIEIGDSIVRLGLIWGLLPALGLRGLVITYYVSSLGTCLMRLACLLRGCGLASGALLSLLRASLPSVLSGALATLAGGMVAVLPLPPVFALVLGCAAVGLGFVTVYLSLSLRHRRRHQAVHYRL